MQSCSRVPSTCDETVGDYKLGQILGRGQFGTVREAEHIVTGKRVAVKIVSISGLSDSVEREVAIQRRLDHQHVVKIFDIVNLEDTMYIVMECVEGGDLFEYIVKQVRLSEDECKRIVWQLMSALEHCHSRNVVHRDIKLENIMLDSTNNVKLVDFGLSAEWKPGTLLTDSCGSPNYAAPEILYKNCEYEGPEIDVWSSGVVLYAMICNALPFDAENLPALFRQIKKGQYTIPGFVSPDARDLLQQMLQVDPMKRLKLDEVKRHRWLAPLSVANVHSDVQEAVATKRLVASRVSQTSGGRLVNTILSAPSVVSRRPLRRFNRHGYQSTDRKSLPGRSRAFSITRKSTHASSCLSLGAVADNISIRTARV